MLELLQFVIDHVLTSRWAWAAEDSLLIILTALTLLLLATVFYSRPIQKLWRDVKSLLIAAGKQAENATKSPYDRELNNRGQATLFFISKRGLSPITLCPLLLLKRRPKPHPLMTAPRSQMKDIPHRGRYRAKPA